MLWLRVLAALLFLGWGCGGSAQFSAARPSAGAVLDRLLDAHGVRDCMAAVRRSPYDPLVFECLAPHPVPRRVHVEVSLTAWM